MGKDEGWSATNKRVAGAIAVDGEIGPTARVEQLKGQREISKPFPSLTVTYGLI
jgi:hypothetical protein